MTEQEADTLIDRLTDAVVDREHCEMPYRRSCQRELDQARDAVFQALMTGAVGKP